MRTRQLRTPATPRSPAAPVATCIAVLAAVLVACGSSASRPNLSASTATAGEVPRLVVPDCDDGGRVQQLCAAGFVVNDTFHGLSCGAVRPDLVTEEIVARGRLEGESVEVRSIEGVSPDVLVAVSVDGGRCGDDDVVLSPWSMAFPGSTSQAETDAAICAVVVEEERERNGCG